MPHGGSKTRTMISALRSGPKSNATFVLGLPRPTLATWKRRSEGAQWVLTRARTSSQPYYQRIDSGRALRVWVGYRFWVGRHWILAYCWVVMWVPCNERVPCFGVGLNGNQRLTPRFRGSHFLRQAHKSYQVVVVEARKRRQVGPGAQSIGGVDLECQGYVQTDFSPGNLPSVQVTHMDRSLL